MGIIRYVAGSSGLALRIRSGSVNLEAESAQASSSFKRFKKSPHEIFSNPNRSILASVLGMIVFYFANAGGTGVYMPIYEYRCNACGSKFEELVKSPVNTKAPCPSCQSGNTTKLMSITGAVGTGKTTDPPCAGSSARVAGWPPVELGQAKSGRHAPRPASTAGPSLGSPRTERAATGRPRGGANLRAHERSG